MPNRTRSKLGSRTATVAGQTRPSARLARAPKIANTIRHNGAIKNHRRRALTCRSYLDDRADKRCDLGRLEFLGMIRRVGVVAGLFVVGCLLVAGLVAIAIRTSVPDAVVVGLVSGVLGSVATAAATLLAVRLTMEGQRRLDQE